MANRDPRGFLPLAGFDPVVRHRACARTGRLPLPLP